MTQARIVSLEVRGFRAFGTDIARFELDAPVTVVHGANSQGKTSLAEAIEFLISGRSSRRDLLGGAKAEYNDSLRNAHLTGGEQVYVEAVVRVAAEESQYKTCSRPNISKPLSYSLSGRQ